MMTNERMCPVISDIRPSDKEMFDASVGFDIMAQQQLAKGDHAKALLANTCGFAVMWCAGLVAPPMVVEQQVVSRDVQVEFENGMLAVAIRKGRKVREAMEAAMEKNYLKKDKQ